MLQLLHMRFTQPAFREDALRRLKDREIEGIRKRYNLPRSGMV